jgi:hypothetical protein
MLTGKKITLINVVYVPDAQDQILSLMKFRREVKLISNFLASTNQNLKGYALLNPGKPDDSIDLLQCSPATLWHLRFRHAFTTRLQNHKLIKSNDNSTAVPSAFALNTREATTNH